MRQFGGAAQSRSNQKTVLLVALGTAFLFFAALAVVVLSGSSDASARVATSQEGLPPPTEGADVRTVTVLVPSREVSAGSLLDPSMFRAEQRPEVSVATIRVIKDFEEIKNYYARTLLVRGQPLHQELITKVRPLNAITTNIPEGYRAVTISVDARTGVMGFAQPGARVDVVWASRIRDKPGVTVIVQNAKVLSAERQTRTDGVEMEGPIPSTITLLVSTEDAAKIQLASTTGAMSLSLRGDEDNKGMPVGRSITIDDLLGGTREEVAPRGPQVTVRSDNGKSEVFVLNPGGKLEALGGEGSSPQAP
jgi:pilus assembly protein CpaB